jgi:pyroglutamyl-peptidase
MKTLLTGFEPFGDVKINSSQLVVERLADRHRALMTKVLPTEYIAAGRCIIDLIERLRPNRIICLGVAEGRDAINLERIALNLDDANVPDNARLQRTGVPIVAGAPLAYASTLPLAKICEGLTSKGIPAAISNHAGTYVCNHVFYLARHLVEIAGLEAQCGFIHLPAISEPTGTEPGRSPGMNLDVMVMAIDYCLSL